MTHAPDNGRPDGAIWHAGGCLCGAIRYEIDPTGAHVDYCHCRMCRKATGGLVIGWVQVPPAQFRLTAGAPREYRSSDIGGRCFCTNCGAETHMTDPKGKTIGASMGTLDDPAAIRPTCHGFDNARPDWLVIDDDLPRYPGPPPHDTD